MKYRFQANMNCLSQFIHFTLIVFVAMNELPFIRLEH